MTTAGRALVLTAMMAVAAQAAPRQPDTVEADGTTALHRAVQQADAVRVRALLADGASPDAANRYGITVLSVACESGSVDVIDALLAAGADPKTAPNGEPPLLVCARTGNVPAVRRLVAAGARVDARERWQDETALMLAVVGDHAPMVKALIALGADVNARARVTRLPQRPGVPSQVFVQVPRGGMTPLMFAARDDAQDIARVLLAAGANVNYQDPGGVTPLLVAVHNGHYDMAALLVEHGARVTDGSLYAAVEMRNLKTNDVRPIPPAGNGRTALELMRLLLGKGADPDAPLTRELPVRVVGFSRPKYLTGMTPLVRAARSADLDTMRVLLEHGAAIRAAAADGTTPLMAVVEGDDGLDDFDFGGRGRLAYREREPGDTLAALSLCLDAKADVNATDLRGVTPLHLAARRGADAVVRALVARGAKLTARDKAGRTPLDEAVDGGIRVMEIVGRVTVPSGEPAVGAMVTLTNVNTGDATVTRAERDGMYRFSRLTPGNYRLVAEQKGVVLSRYDAIAVRAVHESTAALITQMLNASGH